MLQNDMHELRESFNDVLGMRAEEDVFNDSEAHEELDIEKWDGDQRWS